MFAQVNIHTYSLNEALLIPTEAVIRTGNSNRVVLSQGDGGFKSINVEIGRYYEEYAEIVSGLKVGDVIVSSAQFLLDSESSKTSDFKRMESNLNIPQSVWVEAQINSVMLNHKMINVTHLPIPEWDWPEMTMDFITTSDVDLSMLSPEAKVDIQIEKIVEGQYRVTGVRIPSKNINNSDMQNMDHSNHQMNDSSMDHSMHQMNGKNSNQSDAKKIDELSQNDSMDHSMHKKLDHSEHKNINDESSEKQEGDQ
jgi:Cu(I)/Ag(I) efflux system membrane fusion protein